MEISVKDNALNSLEIGLEFYNKFLDNLDTADISVKHYGNLKFTVIAIQNTIELFAKAVLLDVNEFLVFKVEAENDHVLCSLLRKQYDRKRRKANIAYNAIWTQNKYKTISYEKCIKLLIKIFSKELTSNDYKTLDELAQYRNALTHLGYASVYEWYKILITVNKSLNLIIGFFIDNLVNSTDYISDDIINLIVDTLNKCELHLTDIWMASHEATLDEVDNIVYSYFQNDLIKDIEITRALEYHFIKKMCFTYHYKHEKINAKWQFKYSAINEAIIIVDSKENIVTHINLLDEDMKYKIDEDGTPSTLKDFSLYVPKSNIKYIKNTIYDIKSNKNYHKFQIKQNKISTLFSKYLKLITNKD